PTLALSQRFLWWEHTSFSITASGSDVRSASFEGNMVDAELIVGIEHSFTELISLNASIGASQRTLHGERSHGEVGEFKLSRGGERNQWNLSYQRSVTPNGFGGLVERDQANLSVSRQLAPQLNGGLTLLDSRDREVFFFGLFEQARRF